jgi:ribosomal protein S27E
MQSFGGGLVTHDSHFEGDPAALSQSTEGDMDLECGNCLHDQTVVSDQEYSHGITTWQVDWTCESCGQSNSNEGWFDPNDNN